MRRLVLVLLIAAAGCHPSVAIPALPTFATLYQQGDTIRIDAWAVRPIQPSTLHAFVYHMMEECTGERGDFPALLWYQADFLVQINLRTTAMTRLAGLWAPNPSRIYLAREHTQSPEIISHEVLHDLGQGHGARMLACVIRPIDSGRQP